MKNYENHKDNQKLRRTLKRQGFTNIRIENGEVISKDMRYGFVPGKRTGHRK